MTGTGNERREEVRGEFAQALEEQDAYEAGDHPPPRRRRASADSVPEQDRGCMICRNTCTGNVKTTTPTVMAGVAVSER